MRRICLLCTTVSLNILWHLKNSLHILNYSDVFYSSSLLTKAEIGVVWLGFFFLYRNEIYYTAFLWYNFNSVFLSIEQCLNGLRTRVV